jgi:uncharacterized protein (DUF486 family)
MKQYIGTILLLVGLELMLGNTAMLFGVLPNTRNFSQLWIVVLIAIGIAILAWGLQLIIDARIDIAKRKGNF